MFCPGCGAQIPDGSTVCFSCGCTVNQQPIAQAPVYQQQGSYQPGYPVMPSLSEFDKKAKKYIPITFLLSMILLVVSALLPITGDIFDIPLVDSVITLTGDVDEVDDLKEEFNDAIELYEENFEKLEDELDSQEAKYAKNILESGKDLKSNFSLLNFRSLIKETDEAMDYLEDYKSLDVYDEELDQIEVIVDYVIMGTIGLFFLPLLFTLLGGLLKSKGLTITALVFMVITQFIMCGIIWVILSFIIYIAQAILCGKAKRYAVIA